MDEFALGRGVLQEGFLEVEPLALRPGGRRSEEEGWGQSTALYTKWTWAGGKSCTKLLRWGGI